MLRITIIISILVDLIPLTGKQSVSSEHELRKPQNQELFIRGPLPINL